MNTDFDSLYQNYLQAFSERLPRVNIDNIKFYYSAGDVVLDYTLKCNVNSQVFLEYFSPLSYRDEYLKFLKKYFKYIKFKVFEIPTEMFDAQENINLQIKGINFKELEKNLERYSKFYKNYNLSEYKAGQKILNNQQINFTNINIEEEADILQADYSFQYSDKIIIGQIPKNFSLGVVTYLPESDIYFENNISIPDDYTLDVFSTISRTIITPLIVNSNPNKQHLVLLDNNLPLSNNSDINKIYEKIILEEKNLNYLKNDTYAQQIDLSRYISDLQYSTDMFGNINLFFSIDERNLLNNFIEIYKNNTDEETLCEIKNITVFKKTLERNERNARRAVKQQDYVKNSIDIVVYDEKIAQKSNDGSSQIQSGTGKAKMRKMPSTWWQRTIATTQGFTSAPDLISLNTDVMGNNTDLAPGGVQNNESLNFYEIVDRDVLEKKVYYQYGIKITYKTNLKQQLLIYKQNFLEFIKTLQKYQLYSNDKKHYNFTQERFNPEFQSVWSGELGSLLAAYSSVVKKFLLSTVNFKRKYFFKGRIRALDKQSDDSFNDFTLSPLLHWDSASQQSINRTISLINRLIVLVEKQIQTTNDIFETKEHLFPQTIDAYRSANVGYSYFSDDTKPSAGFLVVDNSDLELKIASDIFEYTRDNSIPSDFSNKKYDFITPSKIYSSTKKLENLKNILSISDETLTDLWMDILYNNYNGNIVFSQEKNNNSDYIQKFNDLFNSLSVSIKTKKDINLTNLAIQSFLNGPFVISSRTPEEIIRLNKENIPWHFVALFRNLDKYYSYRAVKTRINSSGQLEQTETITNEKINLNDEEKDWKNNVETIARYLFFYNNIQTIEINIGTGLKYEWEKLTKVYDSLNNNQIYLARLIPYLGVPSYSNQRLKSLTTLPVYDEVFYFTKTFDKKVIEAQIQKQKQEAASYVTKQERRVLQEYDGRIIKETDGSTVYFEEDLSDRTLLNEYIQTFYGQDKYVSNIFSYSRIRQEVLRRFKTYEGAVNKIKEINSLEKTVSGYPGTKLDFFGVQQDNYIFSKSFITDMDLAFWWELIGKDSKYKNDPITMEYFVQYNTYGSYVYAPDGRIYPKQTESQYSTYAFKYFTVLKALLIRYGLEYENVMATIRNNERARIAEEERKRQEAARQEAERKRQEAEAERIRREKEEAERKRREAEEAERRRKEAEEAERKRLYAIKVTDQKNAEKSLWSGDKSIASFQPSSKDNLAQTRWKLSIEQEMKIGIKLYYTYNVYYPPYGSSLYHWTYDKLQEVFCPLIGKTAPISNFKMMGYLNTQTIQAWVLYDTSIDVKFYYDVRKEWYDSNYAAWQKRLQDEAKQNTWYPERPDYLRDDWSYGAHSSVAEAYRDESTESPGIGSKPGSESLKDVRWV